jgi:hypothetical protein
VLTQKPLLTQFLRVRPLRGNTLKNWVSHFAEVLEIKAHTFVEGGRLRRPPSTKMFQLFLQDASPMVIG